ncbi:MAG: T9SS type A sorting domain-containing protein [Bacteroidota bacterium]
MKKIYLKLIALVLIPFGLYSQTKESVTSEIVAKTLSGNSVSSSLANAAPTISFNTTASKFVDLTGSTPVISCVMNNSTDPFIISGIDINVTDEDLSTVTFSMTSSKTTVVSNSNFTITGNGNARKFKITPTGVGYTTLTLKITDLQGSNKSIKLKLAVSASLPTAGIKDIYHTGVADGSTAIPIDNDYMFIADDETNIIKLYSRNNSGLSIYQFDVTSYLNLTGGTEVDMEASFRSPTKPNRIYWIGSLSNSKSGVLRPDRDRIFATDIVGTGANATLTFVGYTDKLRSNIITWGDAKGYNFTAKAASGIEPKRIDGFNVEGLEIGPDNTTLYIGFRAPYVGTGKNKAIICPLLNFENWFGNGNPSANPTFGNPIELDLNNHGIRSLGKNASNEYLIVAGSYAATGTFELYKWNGLSTTTPTLLNADLTSLKVEGIVEVPASLSGTYTVDLVSDLGSSILYNDAVENKDVTEANHRKFLTSTIQVTNPLGVGSFQKEDIYFYPNPVNSILNVVFEENLFTKTNCRIYNDLGDLVKEETINNTDGTASLDLSNLQTGLYFVNFPEINKVFRIIKK